MKLCKCGCGQEVTKETCTYINGHNARGKKNLGVSKALKGRSSPLKGRIRPELSKAKLGIPSPMRGKKGKKRTEKQKENQRLGQLGRKLSPETIVKLRNRKFSPETITKLRNRVITQEWIAKISGDKNPNWKGGLSSEPYDKKFTLKLIAQIRKRDNYICQECGKTENELEEHLSCHHIDYNKKNSSPENLISLCRRCHSKTSSATNRDYWIKRFKNFTYVYREIL